MQQLVMVNHMENTVQAMPLLVQRMLKQIVKWLNTSFQADHNNVRRPASKRADRKRSNCLITGATADASGDLARTSTIHRISEADGSDHARLPDPLIRKISDRYRSLE